MFPRCGPSIPVRYNRTNKLRNMFSVHNEDLAHLLHPPHSETNATIRGKNKSVAKSVQKRVVRWFKDQSAYVDHLGKRQVHAYDNLVRLEKEKVTLQNKHNLGAVRLKPIHRRTDSSAEVGEDSEVNVGEDPESQETTQPPLETVEIPVARKSRVKRLRDRAKAKNNLSTHSTTRSVSNCQNPKSKFTNKNKKPATVRVDRDVDAEEPAPQERTDRSKPDVQPETDTSLLEPVKHYQLRQNGILLALELPYKRKTFRKPRQDDRCVHDRMLVQEQERTTECRQRFNKLSLDLDVLDSWSPMKEIRRQQQKLRAAAEPSSEAADRWKKLGLLGHWMKAFGRTKAWLPAGVDPNSPESLRMCRYLRLNEKPSVSQDEIFLKGKTN